MAVYKREASGWSEQGIMRARSGSEWTGIADAGYAWNGTEWVNFQPLAASDLNPPESLVVLPSDTSASATWVNPTQDVGNEPTHLQLRIPETTDVWTEYAMDVAAASVGFLTESTNYQWQIRYIIREDGSITKTSPITEAFFTTTALSGPGTPAADPGGSGPDTTIPWGGTGNDGPVGGPGCWWEYIVQTADTPASGTITFSDTAVTGSFDGDAGSLDIDFVAEGLTCGQAARMKYRENCDGTPGDYAYGDPFVIACDWSADCGGNSGSASFAIEPFTDAIHAMPKVCVAAFDPLQIEDHVVSGLTYGKLDGFLSVSKQDNDDVLIAKNTNGTLGKPVAAGKVGALALLEDADDASFTLNVMLDEVPGGSGGGGGVAPASFPIVRWGKNVAISAVFATTTTWYPRASYIDANGDFVTLTSSTALSLDAWHTVTLTMDSDGTKTLYADAISEATDTSNVAPAFSDAGIGQDVEIYLNESGRIRRVCAWDRVLSEAEVGLVNAPKNAPYLLSSTVSIETTQTFSASIPTFEAGDLVIAIGRHTGRYAYLEPGMEGWSSGFASSGVRYSGYEYSLYWKIMETGDATTLDINYGSTPSGNTWWGIWVFRGVDPNDPFVEGPPSLFTTNASTVNGQGVIEAYTDPEGNAYSSFNIGLYGSGWTVVDGGTNIVPASAVNLEESVDSGDTYFASAWGVENIVQQLPDKADRTRNTSDTSYPRPNITRLAGSASSYRAVFALRGPRLEGWTARPKMLGKGSAASSSLSASGINLDFDLTSQFDVIDLRAGDVILLWLNNVTTIHATGDWTLLDTSAPDTSQHMLMMRYDGVDDGSTTGLSLTGSSVYANWIALRNCSMTEAVAFDTWSDYEDTGASSVPANSGMSPTVTDITPAAADNLLITAFYTRSNSAGEQLELVTANGWELFFDYTQVAGGADGWITWYFQWAADTSAVTLPEVRQNDLGDIYIVHWSTGALVYEAHSDYIPVPFNTFIWDGTSYRADFTDSGFMGVQGTPSDAISWTLVGGAGGGQGNTEGGGGGGGEVTTPAAAALSTRTPVKLGWGGSGGVTGLSAASNGRDTVVGALTAAGGQGGGDDYYNNADAAGLGGGGGGIAGNGNLGGAEAGGLGGGGGGQGAAGQAAGVSAAIDPGDGGVGTTTTATDGTTVIPVGGGGGGGGSLGGVAGAAGDASAGAGGDPPGSGARNQGGGGGGRHKNFGGATSGGTGGGGRAIAVWTP